MKELVEVKVVEHKGGDSRASSQALHETREITEKGAALRNSEPRNSGLDFHIRLFGTAGINARQCGGGARAQMVRQGFEGGTTPEEDLDPDSWKQTREQMNSCLVIKTEHGD